MRMKGGSESERMKEERETKESKNEIEIGLAVQAEYAKIDSCDNSALNKINRGNLLKGLKFQ